MVRVGPEELRRACGWDGRVGNAMGLGTGSAGTFPAGNTVHYATLDGLRGVAAVAVVAFHAPAAVVAGWRPESAFLAVDFFFVLSGFVIAHAYDERLGRGLTGLEFLRRRVIRLFPLYLVASALAAMAAAAAVFVLHDASQWTAGKLLICVTLAAVMLPSPVTPLLFPLNDASWSLFFEFVANGIYATRVWQRGPLVTVVPALAVIGLVVLVTLCGTVDRGAQWDDPWWYALFGGGVRVMYSFTVGLLIYRHRAALPAPRIPVIALMIILAALLWVDPPGGWRPVFDLVFVLVLSPAIVAVGYRSAPRTRPLARFCGFLGSISYPIYVLHRPLTNIVAGSGHRLVHNHFVPQWHPIYGLAALALLVAVSALADKADMCVRRVLSALRRPAPMFSHKQHPATNARSASSEPTS